MRTIPFTNAKGEYQIEKVNLFPMPSNAGNIINVIDYIGSPSAEKEWNADPKLAKHMFLHTEAYREFWNESSLILLGRTGTGKTSILMSLKDEIESSNIDKNKSSYNKFGYTHAITIDFYDLVTRMAECEDVIASKTYIIATSVAKAISIFINILIMQKMCNQKDFPEDKYTSIINYLKAQNMYKSTSVQNLVNIFLKSAKASKTGNNKVDAITNIVGSIGDVINTFASPEYTKALNELLNYLKDKKILVLIDSFHEYDVTQGELMLIVKGLIHSCFKFYNNPQDNIFVKLALPSEIYNKVLIRLAGKELGNTVVVRWKYKELIVMLALRIFSFYTTGEDPKIKSLFEFCSAFKYNDFYSDINAFAYDNALKLLSNILPEKCPTNLSYNCPTLPYCMRHTLKKPREVMRLFNTFVTEIIRHNNAQYFIENPELIKRTIHSTQDFMIGSALSMYADSYRSIYSACIVLLHDATFIFTGQEIHDRIKKAIQVARNRDFQNGTTLEISETNEAIQIDQDDLSRVLFESGLVGEVSKINTVRSGNPFFDNRDALCIINADFEYKITSTATPYLWLDDRQYVLHPMCYETYHCFVDIDTLVYPDRTYDDGDVIDTILTTSVPPKAQ